LDRPETRQELHKTILNSNTARSVKQDETNVDRQELQSSVLKLNTKTDGKNFISHSESGTKYSNTSERNIQRQGNTSYSNDNCRSVRAVWTKYKNLQFKKTNNIKKLIARQVFDDIIAFLKTNQIKVATKKF
jgi:hypothetical protein